MKSTVQWHSKSVVKLALFVIAIVYACLFFGNSFSQASKKEEVNFLPPDQMLWPFDGESNSVTEEKITEYSVPPMPVPTPVSHVSFVSVSMPPPLEAPSTLPPTTSTSSTSLPLVDVTNDIETNKPSSNDNEATYASDIENMLSQNSLGDNVIMRRKMSPEEENQPGRESNATHASEHNYTSPWTWVCREDHKCHRLLRQSNTTDVSLDTCWLTCGPTRTLWPKPKMSEKINLGKRTMGFHIKDLHLKRIKAPSEMVKDLTETAFVIMKQNVKLLYPPFYEKSDRDLTLRTKVVVSFEIDASDDLITLLTDESYTLKIKEKFKQKSLMVMISGKTFFGVRHGLETLSQLIVFDDAVNSLQILTSVKLSDSPAFPYRGLMIDTARNFIPIYAIQRMIDGMSYNKLNMLHWHLTDSNSFPFYSTAVPEMTNYGAYSENEIYYPQDVKALVDYALVRGVKIIPELDAPAHAGNGWQWGEERKGYGQLALCVNEEPFNGKCGQPPCGQLNPANPKVYEVLGSLYGDMLDVFDSDLFHMGGDEVTFECWKTEEINNFMSENNITDFLDLRAFFQRQAFKELEMAARKKVLESPIPILWTSGLTTVLTNMTGIEPSNYIIQTWEGDPKSSLEVQRLVEAKYPLIVSNMAKVYLDWGDGTWLGSSHNWGHINWQVLYNFDFEKNGYNITQRVMNSKFGEIPQIIGGEAPLWTEKVNEVTMDAKLWPRGAAFAERLWTNPHVTDHLYHLVYPRLLRHNERMKLRGILVDTRQPKSCLLINSNCDNTQDVEPD